MSFFAEYPESRYIISKATVSRDVVLPDGIRGTLLVRSGQRVEINTVIARGNLPARHHIVDAAKILRLRNPDDLEALMTVEVGQQVEEGDVLTSRGRRVRATADGTVASVAEGRIIIREEAEEIELVAGMAGFVVETYPRRGAVIQTAGGLLQGVWGNGHRAVGAIKIEPEDGLELIQGDDINLEWRGAIVMTRSPLSELGMRVMEDQDISGVIAPGMDSTLIDVALTFNRAIMLTEGFGSSRISVVVQQYLIELLETNPNVRGTLDAVQPSVFGSRRPELLVNVPLRSDEEPPAPRTADRLRTGVQVRVVGASYMGQAGIVEEVPRLPVQVEGGMRVPCARVRLTVGEVITVPIANLEVFAG